MAALESLILELARAGWRTIVSSREGEAISTVWISFGSSGDLEAFLNTVAPLEADLVSRRARASWRTSWPPEDGPDSAHVKGAWQYYASPAGAEDRAVDIGVLLPASDLDEVLERVRSANARAPTPPTSARSSRRPRGRPHRSSQTNTRSRG